MKIKYLLWTFVILALIIGCGATRPPIRAGEYAFEHKGNTYRIESMTPHTKEGYNMLVQKEGKNVILRAIDKEQDGILDEVVQGNLSLAEADEIYQKGIALAKVNGNFKSRKFPRAYRTSDVMNDYELRTFILTVGETYNRLSIVNKKTLEEETVVVDLSADGHINETQKGREDIGYYQKIYQRILDRGLKEGRVVKTEGKYHVAMQK